MAARKPNQPPSARRKKTAAGKASGARKNGSSQKLQDLQRETSEMRENLRQLELQQAESVARAERLADLYNFAPIACLTLNRHGQVLDLNLAAAGLLRRGRQSVLGAPLGIFVQQGHLDAFLEHLRRCEEGRDRVATDLELLHPEGQVVPIRLITTPLPFRPHLGGKVHQAVMIDQTEQRNLERSLRETQEHLRMALRCANAGYWSIDLATRRSVWSPEFYDLLGLDPDVALPSEIAFLDLLLPADRIAAERQLESVFAGQFDEFRGEFRLRLHPKGFRWIGIFGKVTRSRSGTPVRVGGIGIDLTTQKEAQQVLQKAHTGLDRRVRQRTAELQAAKTNLELEVVDRKRLERQILEISERERRRMGQDLHDGLGQQITGIIFHAHLLHKQLAAKGSAEAEMADQIVSLLNDAKIQARHIARGLQPVDAAPNGLMAGLDHFASTTSELYHIDCRFFCPEPVMISEHNTATHLFRIAQEAVANAFRHGGAQKIEIHLRETDDGLDLQILDHGSGLPKTRRREGLGLRFMKYRAETIGGTIDIRRRPGGGTMVRCRVRIPAGTNEAE